MEKSIFYLLIFPDVPKYKMEKAPMDTMSAVLTTVAPIHSPLGAKQKESNSAFQSVLSSPASFASALTQRL